MRLPLDRSAENDKGGDSCRLRDAPRWVHEADLSLLTVREREIFVVLGDCLPNTIIASHFHITERTVKKHVASIFFKLKISSRAEAAVIATCRKHELRPNSGLQDTGRAASAVTPSSG